MVDNGSRAEQPRLRDLVPDGTRVLVAPANLGYAGGANLALEDWLATRTDSYCLIGSHDLHVSPETMVTLVTTARRHPTFGILAPDLDWTRPASRENTEVSPQPLGWVSGTAMLIGRQSAVDVGRFDERFSSYVEDVDFCWRARLAGWRVGLVPGAQAHGLGDASPRAGEYIAANRILLELKHHGARGLCAAVLRGSGGSVVTSLGFGRGGGARQSDRPRARPPCRTVARYGSRHDGSGPSRNPRSVNPCVARPDSFDDSQRIGTTQDYTGAPDRDARSSGLSPSAPRVDPEAGKPRSPSLPLSASRYGWVAAALGGGALCDLVQRQNRQRGRPRARPHSRASAARPLRHRGPTRSDRRLEPRPRARTIERDVRPRAVGPTLTAPATRRNRSSKKPP